MAEPAEQRRIALGRASITYLPDGYGRYDPVPMFPASTAEGWQRHKEWLDSDGRLPLSFGAILVEIGGRQILVDTGYGEKTVEVPGVATRVGGRLLGSLNAAGLKPEGVDIVVYTHLHHDHVGWTSLAADGGRRLTFPKARHLVRRSEWDHWQGTDAIPGPSLAEVQQPLESRIEFVEDGQSIVPGMSLMATPGHTPGHASVIVSSDNERAIILGDAVHCPVQLEEADWACLADVDPVLGRRTRERLWQELEAPSTITAGGHFAECTFGRVIQAQGKRSWQGWRA